jgi:hypothetical protein
VLFYHGGKDIANSGEDLSDNEIKTCPQNICGQALIVWVVLIRR